MEYSSINDVAHGIGTPYLFCFKVVESCRDQSESCLFKGRPVRSFKVGSHDPVSIQLTMKIFACVIEIVGVYTVQFLHPIIS